jgi:hypothetical protein
MKVMATFIGAALTAASLAFAGPVFAAPGHAGFAPHSPSGGSDHAVGAVMGGEHSDESVGLGATSAASAAGASGGTHDNACETFGASGPC